MFDNTVILWASDFGNGWTHEVSWRETSWTLIGNGGDYYKAGRYLKFGGDSQYAHNRLLLSLAQTPTPSGPRSIAKAGHCRG